MRPVTLGLAALLAAGMPRAQHVPVTSADAADAAERISGHRAHMTGEIHRLAGTRVAGPAITLRIVRDDNASLLDEGLKVIRIVEEAPPGAVIVACLDGDKDFAVFGATFAMLAKSRRLGGFVVDGGVRGIADLRRIGVPVFARSAVPGSAGGHYRLEQSQTTVRCGGTDVAPGDLVVGDEDGVAVVPGAIQAEVLARATALRREKDAMLPLIAKHRSYTQALEEYRRRAEAARKP
jgi:regulator of RNase E activity RraA